MARQTVVQRTHKKLVGASGLKVRIDQFRIALNLVRKFIYNWLKVKAGNTIVLEPIFALYLITKRCNFRCVYCYAESNERISRIAPQDLNFKDTLKLLKIMRQDVENLYFSGGEPLLRSDLLDVLKACRELDYHILALTTNGILLPKKPNIVDYLDYLAISLDTLDPRKNDAMSGVKAGTTEKLIGIIKEFASLQQERNFSLLINAVITKDNISDIYDLMEFCFKYNIGLSVIGQMENFRPISYLRESAEYRKLIECIINYNSKGYPILGMPEFNRTLLLFEDHTCFPTLIPTVYPNGDLLYPCEVLNERRYNLLEVGSIQEAYRRGQKELGAKISCPGECYLPAFITASCFMEQPLEAIKQGIKLKMGNCYNTEIKENRNRRKRLNLVENKK